jgi:glycosyltransferase involved in cell wall biosynthesis
MRIGFDATPISPGKSGIGYHVEFLVRALAELDGIDEILLFSNRRPVFDGPPPARTRWIERGGFPKRAPWMHLILPLLIEREKPDVVHYVNFNAPILHPHPFVVTFHDMVLYRHPEFFTWKKRILTRSLMPHVARRAGAIITVTEAMRAEIVGILGVPKEKVSVVPPAPGEIFAPVADPALREDVARRHGLDGPYVLTVATLEPRKNLAGLLRAFDLLISQTGLPHRLAVAGGKGWMYTPILGTIRSLEHADRVRVLDYVPLPDLPALYTGADLMVFPSFYEGFGMPPVEAMRCATPVVVSDIPALREVTGDASVQVDPRSIESIAGGMRRVLTDPAMAGQMRRRGSQVAARYTWPKAARLSLEVYRRVLAASR